MFLFKEKILSIKKYVFIKKRKKYMNGFYPLVVFKIHREQPSRSLEVVTSIDKLMVRLATIRAVITFKEKKFDMAKICQIIITFVAV